jgi:hypothetical protein
MQDEFNSKLTLSQTRLQELNMVVDRIMSVTKQIERFALLKPSYARYLFLTGVS